MANWMDVTATASAIGSLLSGATLVTGFRIYRIGKRDEYVSHLRQLLSRSRSSCQRLDMLLTYEVINEIVSTVVYSNDMSQLTNEIFISFIHPGDATENALKVHLTDPAHNICNI